MTSRIRTLALALLVAGNAHAQTGTVDLAHAAPNVKGAPLCALRDTLGTDTYVDCPSGNVSGAVSMAIVRSPYAPRNAVFGVLYLTVGDRIGLDALLFEEHGTLFRQPAWVWASSQTGVATVPGGTLTALTAGETTISVQLRGNTRMRRTIKVCVAARDLVPLYVAPNATDMVSTRDTIRLVARDSLGTSRSGLCVRWWVREPGSYSGLFVASGGAARALRTTVPFVVATMGRRAPTLDR